MQVKRIPVHWNYFQNSNEWFFSSLHDSQAINTQFVSLFAVHMHFIWQGFCEHFCSWTHPCEEKQKFLSHMEKWQDHRLLHVCFTRKCQIALHNVFTVAIYTMPSVLESSCFPPAFMENKFAVIFAIGLDGLRGAGGSVSTLTRVLLPLHIYLRSFPREGATSDRHTTGQSVISLSKHSFYFYASQPFLRSLPLSTS